MIIPYDIRLYGTGQTNLISMFSTEYSWPGRTRPGISLLVKKSICRSTQYFFEKIGAVSEEEYFILIVFWQIYCILIRLWLHNRLTQENQSRNKVNPATPGNCKSQEPRQRPRPRDMTACPISSGFEVSLVFAIVSLVWIVITYMIYKFFLL